MRVLRVARKAVSIHKPVTKSEDSLMHHQEITPSAQDQNQVAAARAIPQEAFDWYDEYAHGLIDRRTFLAASFNTYCRGSYYGHANLCVAAKLRIGRAGIL